MSEQIKNGGPAFPNKASYDGQSGYDIGGGMTLRDYFAAKAMQSFMQGAVLPDGFDASEQLALVGTRAYETADAMLAAREVKA